MLVNRPIILDSILMATILEQEKEMQQLHKQIEYLKKEVKKRNNV